MGIEVQGRRRPEESQQEKCLDRVRDDIREKGLSVEEVYDRRRLHIRVRLKLGLHDRFVT